MSTIQDPDPPDTRLTIALTIVILRRLVEARRLDDDDVKRVGALVRALDRLHHHLGHLQGQP